MKYPLNMKKASLLILCGVVCVLSVFAQQEDRLFREAERRFLKGDYQFAFSRYQELIDEYPDSRYVADSKFRQAVIHTYLEDSNEALEMLKRISERYPNTRYYHFIPFWQGYNFFRLGEYETALEYFTSYVKEGHDSLSREALFYKAMCERNVLDRETALVTVKILLQRYDSPLENPQALLLYSSLLVETERYQELYELYLKTPVELLDEEFRQRLSLYRAEAFFQEGRLEEAEPVYMDLLDEGGDIQTTAYKRLFVLYGRKNQTDEQQNIFEEAQTNLANRPSLLAEFLLRAGIQQYKDERYSLAQSYLRRVWRTVPADEIDGLVPLYLAYILEKNGESGQAVQLIEEYMLRSDDNREELLYALGRIESSRENWKKAAELLEKFLVEFPESVNSDETRYIFAHALYRDARLRESLAVVQEGFSRGEGAAFDRELLRLRARIFAELNQPEKAILDLREYIPRYPDDIDAFADLAKLYFQQGMYEKIHSVSADAMKSYPFAGHQVSSKDGASWAKQSDLLKLLYMDGMAYMKQGKYSEAAAVFAQISGEELVAAELEDLVPYLFFYKGWIHYSQVEYEDAAEWFSRLIEEYPDSDRVPEAVYLSGWAAYANENYMLAQQSFGEYSRIQVPEDEKVRGLFMYAKSSTALGKSDDAMLMYQTLYTDYPMSTLADDALFEYAALLQSTGRSGEAVRIYYSVYNKYPTSPLGEEALFRRGDILYRTGDYSEARDAFYEHRVRYPRGSMVDVSLYWSGHSALKTDQPYGAVLVWEKLAEQFPGSGFYSEALLELARLYTELGEYQLSVSAYSRYLASNPEASAGDEARKQIDTLKRVMAGQDSRVAELNVQIEREGLDSSRGSRAGIELSRLYLYQFPEKMEDAYLMLRKILAQNKSDRSITAHAQYLTGEYYRKKSEPGKAAEAYAEAAVSGAGDDDLVARSLFRSAESAVDAGDTLTARQMVQKLRADFPHTQWVVEGDALLEQLNGRNGAGE